MYQYCRYCDRSVEVTPNAFSGGRPMGGICSECGKAISWAPIGMPPLSSEVYLTAEELQTIQKIHKRVAGEAEARHEQYHKRLMKAVEATKADNTEPLGTLDASADDPQKRAEEDARIANAAVPLEEPVKEPRFKTGDVVACLDKLSQSMAVEVVGVRSVECVWFDGDGKLQRKSFPEESLTFLDTVERLFEIPTVVDETEAAIESKWAQDRTKLL
jgi:uncharacterized protein YodC (DUF2158 family)